MHGALARTNLLGRNVVKSLVRNGSHGGVPGENLPFSMNNRYWLTWNYLWYTASGLGAPFILLALQMKKK